MERITLRERQRQAREDAILDAARDLLMEQGYADMSMDDLAARVGASKATLYQHFPSKEDLTINVIVRMMRRGEERLLQNDQGQPAIVRLERALKHGLTQRAGMWGARVGVLPHSVIGHPQYQAQHCRMLETLSALIEQGKAEGDIALQIATPIVARMLFNLFRSDFEDLTRSGAYTPEQVSGTLVDMVLNGIRTRRGDTAPSAN